MKKYIFILHIFVAASLLVAGQNVGIGTTAPAEKLHVSGNIKADSLKPNAIKLVTNAANGKVLTSDASGNASWQTTTAAEAAGNVGFGVWGDCATNGNISEYQPVVDPTPAIRDSFGTAVAISGNFAIVGAPLDDVGSNIDQGSVSFYQFNGTNWVFFQKFTDPAGAAADNFGISVSISDNFAIVGCFGDNIGADANQGSATVLQYNGSSWVFMQQLLDLDGDLGDYFGNSVCISNGYAIIGAYGDNVGSNGDQGSAFIFQFNGTSWQLSAHLTDATGAAGDQFGNSVSISGNYAIVGAHLDDETAGTNQGSASIYNYNGSNWVFMQKLTDATGEQGDQFGHSVSISANQVIVGAPFDNGPFSSDGSASIYRYPGDNWVLMQKLIDPNGAAGDMFGFSVSISGNYAIVGAPLDNGTFGDRGSASIYLRVGLGWQRLQYITDPGSNVAVNDEYFGQTTAIDAASQRFLIGAPKYINYSGKVVFGKVN